MKIIIYRDNFKQIKDHYQSKIYKINCFDYMLKNQFHIKDTEDINSIEIEVDNIKTY